MNRPLDPTPTAGAAEAPGADDARVEVGAYVDGELPDAARHAFERRLAVDPALASAVARERALRERLSLAWSDALDEPVPDRLSALLAAGPAPVLGSSGTSPARLPARDPARAANDDAPWGWAAWGGLAASLVAGLLLGGRMAPPAAGGGPDLVASASGRLVARAGLAQALETAQGGTRRDGVSVGLSFVSRDGRYCRTFVAGDAATANEGLACKADGGWSVAWLTRTAPAPGAEAGGPTQGPAAGGAAYRTAASPLSPALLAAIDARRAGDPLDAAQEAAARAAGWHAPVPPSGGAASAPAGAL